MAGLPPGHDFYNKSMAKINYSGLVDSIQGKLNGSTLRVQNGTGIIQNKPYRNPIGMAGVADLTENNGEGFRTFWNQAYFQAVQYIAHNGNPFSQTVDEIRDIIAGYGWTKVAADGSDIAVIATAYAPTFLPITLPELILNPSLTLPAIPDFTVDILVAGTEIFITVATGLTAPLPSFQLSLSPGSPIINYRLRQRVGLRLGASLVSSGTAVFNFFQADFNFRFIPGEWIFCSFTWYEIEPGPVFAVGPCSQKILAQVHAL